MDLMKQTNTDGINSPLIHEGLLKNIHKVSRDEISRAAEALRLIAEHLKTKKQEKLPADFLPIYLVF